MSRKTAREIAMKMAYGKFFECDDTYDTILKISGSDSAAEPQDVEFADSLVKGIAQHEEEIDGLISGALSGWTIDRLPKVDLSILRIAVYELLFDRQAPQKVVINEAVRIATRYGGDDSPKYINGVLGSIVRSMADD